MNIKKAIEIIEKECISLAYQKITNVKGKSMIARLDINHIILVENIRKRFNKELRDEEQR